MKLYLFILAIFGFTAWMIAINSMGVFTANMPTQTNTAINQTQITELTQANKAESGGLLGDIGGMLGMAGAAVSIFVSAIKSVLSFPGLLEDYGIPLPITILFATMLTIIAVFGLAKLITNRSDKGME